MHSIKSLTGPMRVPFLLLNPACVLAGAGAACWKTGRIDVMEAALVLVGAVLAHVSVNALNEYHDFRSGLDSRTSRTPFSGGSGTLQARPNLSWWALSVGLGSALAVAAIGIYFLRLRGPLILLPGLAGLAVILAYTPLLTRSPALCLVAPGLGFGTFMVVGTEFALSGSYSLTGFFASLVPFFLVSDLLLLNQFPDVEADRASGRRHLIIVLGRKAGAVVYGLFLAGCYASILTGVLAGFLPPLALLGLATLPLAVAAAHGAMKYKADIPRLIPFMGMNVILNLATPLLVGVGLMLAS
jgi:1,4-dihydroxy-2-naphthoate octaprenyltransferase